MTDKARRIILAVNAGSSSVKFQVFDLSPDLEFLAKGGIANLGGMPSFAATDEKTQGTDRELLPAAYTHEAAFQLILDWIDKRNEGWQITAITHCIVHGGTAFRDSVRVTPKVIEQLRALRPFAPLHEPHNLAAIEIIGKLRPCIIQIACFDTAFHPNHEALFTEYALPQKMRDEGIRRYGFHGLSYEWQRPLHSHRDRWRSVASLLPRCDDRDPP
jgi:acetate kinase